MVERRNPNWLCKLGLHKWREYGESVAITWKEPALVKTPRERFARKSRAVFVKRICLRCRTRMKRRLATNPDGSLSSIGWEPLSEFEYEKDEYEAS